jgi:DNA recombination protein RmuC
MIEWLLLALGGLHLLLLLWLALRLQSAPKAQDADEQRAWQQQHVVALQAQSERLERELRSEIAQSGVQGRQEAMQTLSLFQQALLQQSAEATRTQNQQIDALAQQLALLQKSLTDSLAQQVTALSEANTRRLSEMRSTMETQLTQLQQSNAAKLDEMRQTVDEKLQATLQARLGESFKQVADRLEQVHKGLGEMHTLAQGVGDLKHLLTNVKTRGMFGEAQLSALLEQVRSACPVARTTVSPCGCRSMPNSPMKTTSACSKPRAAPIRCRPSCAPRLWKTASSSKPSRSPKSTSSPRTPPTLR